jgi:hypothetical protein
MNRLISHRITLLLLLLIPLLALGSCKKNRTVKPLSQLKKEQRHAIDRLIKESSFRIVNRNDETLPETIDPNVFYKLSNGLYLRVIDKGSARPEVGKTVVAVEIKGYFFNDSQAKGAEFDNVSEAGVRPLLFRYISQYSSDGTVHYSPINDGGLTTVYDNLLCEGVAFPMSVLGNGAVVELIVPFELGPSQNYTAGNSIYVQRASYVFYEKPKQ